MESIKNLKQQLSESLSLEKRIAVLSQLTASLLQDAPTEANTYASNLLQIANQNNLIKEQALAYKQLGTVHWYKGNYPKALKFYVEALTIYEHHGTPMDVAKIHHNLAITYSRQADYEKALEHFAVSIKVFEEEGDALLLAHTFNDIGVIYNKNSNYTSALEHYYKALEIYNAKEYFDGISTVHLNIGLVFSQQNNWTSALNMYEKALHFSQKANMPYRIISALLRMGSAYTSLKKLEKAFSYYKRALKLAQKHHFEELTARCFLELGKIEIAKTKYDNALQYLFLSLEICEQYEIKGYITENLQLTASAMLKYQQQQKTKGVDRESMLLHNDVLPILEKSKKMAEVSGNVQHLNDIYEALSEYFKQIGDYEKAFHYLQHYTTVQKKLFHQKNIEAVSKLQIEFETKQKEQQIQLQQVELEKKELQLHQKTEIEKINKKLELLVQQRTEKLKHQNQQLRQFAYIVAHDLKSPLRNIGRFTGLLKRRLNNRLRKDEVELMDFLFGNVKQMDALLNDLLIYTTLDDDETKHRMCDMERLLHKIELILDREMDLSDTDIEIDDLPKIKVNPTHMTLLFQNLLSNAIKFRHPERHCEIEISANEEDNHYVFAISDNGIGIEKSYQQQIFKIFQRLDTLKYDGTGIGLAICQKIVQMYGGRIWVESEFGVGSTFYFTIPIAG